MDDRTESAMRVLFDKALAWGFEGGTEHARRDLAAHVRKHVVSGRDGALRLRLGFRKFIGRSDCMDASVEDLMQSVVAQIVSWSEDQRCRRDDVKLMVTAFTAAWNDLNEKHRPIIVAEEAELTDEQDVDLKALRAVPTVCAGWERFKQLMVLMCDPYAGLDDGETVKMSEVAESLGRAWQIMEREDVGFGTRVWTDVIAIAQCPPGDMPERIRRLALGPVAQLAAASPGDACSQEPEEAGVVAVCDEGFRSWLEDSFRWVKWIKQSQSLAVAAGNNVDGLRQEVESMMRKRQPSGSPGFDEASVFGQEAILADQLGALVLIVDSAFPDGDAAKTSSQAVGVSESQASAAWGGLLFAMRYGRSPSWPMYEAICISIT